MSIWGTFLAPPFRIDGFSQHFLLVLAKVVLAAVSQCADALAYATEDLQSDVDVGGSVRPVLQERRRRRLHNAPHLKASSSSNRS
eukprot:3478799-Amphidinium_carterae.1